MSEEASFHSFLSFFRSSLSSLSSELSHLPDKPTLDGQRQSLSTAEQYSDDITTLIANIEPDLRHYPYTLRIKCQQQLDECQSQYDTQLATLQRYQSKVHSGQQVASSNPRNDLLGPTSSDPASSKQYQQRRHLLLSSRAVLGDGDESLDNTQRLLAEAADVGAKTSTQLVQQREQFQGQIETLDDTNHTLRRSGGTLREMTIRVLTKSTDELWHHHRVDRIVCIVRMAQIFPLILL